MDDTSQQQHQTNKKGGVRGKPCICGLCNCSKKHQCPIHYTTVTQYDALPQAQSEYCTIYCHDLSSRGPRGIKLHPRIVPSFPKSKIASSTVYNRAFPDPGLQEATESSKPDYTYKKSDSKFYDETSYEAEFFEHPIQIPMTHSTDVTLPTIKERASSYITSNETFFKHWKDTSKCRPLPYCEPNQAPFFSGLFNGETVTMREFASKSAKPRICYRPIDERCAIDHEAKFADRTTTKDTFNLPQLIEYKRDTPFLKNDSKNNQETMEPITGGTFQSLTQYQRDNPQFHKQPKRRHMLPPPPETISLTSKYKLPLITAQKSSYPNWGNQKLVTPLKREEQYCKLTGPICSETEYSKEYKPHPQCHEEYKDENIAQVCHYPQKRLPFPVSVNQSEYFQFKTVHPRHRHGDKAERIYCGPSTTKFGGVTKYESDYAPIPGKPAECCKPPEQRHKIEGKFSTTTSYTEQYPKQPLPYREVCPAQLLLMQP